MKVAYFLLLYFYLTFIFARAHTHTKFSKTRPGMLKLSFIVAQKTPANAFCSTWPHHHSHCFSPVVLLTL